MARKKNHILNAVKSIAEAQKELEVTVAKHGKIIESQGVDIANLEKRVIELRNQAIQSEIINGMATKDVASKYNISSARVSQIAPRRKH